MSSTGSWQYSRPDDRRAQKHRLRTGRTTSDDDLPHVTRHSIGRSLARRSLTRSKYAPASLRRGVSLVSSRGVPLRAKTGDIVPAGTPCKSTSTNASAPNSTATERKRLAEAERDLQLTIDAIPVFVAILITRRHARLRQPDLDGDYMGLRRGGRQGQAKDVPHFHPEVSNATTRLARFLASGEPCTIEVRGCAAPTDNIGGSHPGACPCAMRTGESSDGIRSASDIDDQKRAEEALRESERYARLIVDSIPGMVAVFTPDGEVEAVNRQVLEFFGRTAEEMKRLGDRRRGSSRRSAARRRGLQPIPRVGRALSSNSALGVSTASIAGFSRAALPLRDAGRTDRSLVQPADRHRREEARRRGAGRERAQFAPDRRHDPWSGRGVRARRRSRRAEQAIPRLSRPNSAEEFAELGHQRHGSPGRSRPPHRQP